MKDEAKIEAARHSSQALLRHLSQFALSIFNTAESKNPADWNLFSGTLVQIGDRLFTCTASHCIDQGASLSRYWIMDDRLRYDDEEKPRVVAAHCSQSDPPDVGILELDRARFGLCSTKVPCSTDRIKLYGTGRNDRPVTLIGTPSQFVKKEQKRNIIGFNVVGISYNSVADPPFSKVWARAEPPADAEIDIILDYPAGNNETRRLDTQERCELPKPGGMSGGGLWDQGFQQQELWKPEDASLFGIQVSWHEDKRYVRAVQIVHWLRLVHNHYPDLRPILEDRLSILKVE